MIFVALTTRLQQQKEQQSRRPVGFDTNLADPAAANSDNSAPAAANSDIAAAADKTNETKA